MVVVEESCHDLMLKLKRDLKSDREERGGKVIEAFKSGREKEKGTGGKWQERENAGRLREEKK